MKNGALTLGVTGWVLVGLALAIAAYHFYSACSWEAYAEEYGGTGAASPYTDADLDGDGYGDNVPFSVPTSITFAVRADGTLIAPDNICIENHGTARMRVSGVQVASLNGLSFVSGSEQLVEDDTVSLEFGVEGAMINAASCAEKASVEGSDAWAIGAGEALPLLFSGAVSHISKDIGTELQFGAVQWFVESDAVDSRAGDAYAVLDSNGKLTFFRSKGVYSNNIECTVRNIMGNERSGRVFSNVENASPSPSAVPWRAQSPQVLAVGIAENQEIVPASTAYWFYGCTNMQSCDLSGLDTSNTRSMAGMFENCTSLVGVDLSVLDTSSVESMIGMFRGCRSLTSVDLGSFKTGKLQNMNSMFYDCAALSTLDLSGFDTSRVTNFGSLVSGCTNLEHIIVRGFDMRSAESVNCMFCGCIKLGSIDLRGFDMSNVRNAYGMFYDCRELVTIYTDPGADWSTFFPEDSVNMFWRCLKLQGGAGTAFIAFPNNAYRNGKEHARVDGLDGKQGFFTCISSDALSDGG